MLESLTAINSVAIVQSDTTVIDTPLKAIIILKAGTLKIRNGRGVDVTVVFPAAADGGAYPFTLLGRADKVYADTTLADAEMLGLK